MPWPRYIPFMTVWPLVNFQFSLPRCYDFQIAFKWIEVSVSLPYILFECLFLDLYNSYLKCMSRHVQWFDCDWSRLGDANIHSLSSFPGPPLSLLQVRTVGISPPALVTATLSVQQSTLIGWRAPTRSLIGRLPNSSNVCRRATWTGSSSHL